MILLLPPRKNPNTEKMMQSAKDCGVEVRQLSSWRPPEELQNRNDVIAYGEPLFVAAMAEFLDLVLLEPHFNFLPELANAYTKRKVELTNLALARKREGRIFAKPADDKSFPAGVYDNGNCIKASDLLPGDIPVLISEIVEWEVEYRFFILDRQIQTFSVYLRKGELVDEAPPNSESNEAVLFVTEILNDHQVQIPPGVVLDVGIIANRGWAVLEANPAFGAGIYSCDPTKVLPVLSRCVLSRNVLQEEDKRWILKRTGA